MKNILKFILFICYTMVIFFSSSWIVFAVEALINIIALIVLKINVKKALKNLLGISIILIIMFVANALIVDLNYAIIISIRLILVCNATYIFTTTMTYTEFGNVIEKVLTPLKIFGINNKDISLIVCIAIAFIPILKNEFIEIKMAVKLKGYKLTLTRSLVILKPFFISIFKRMEDISNALVAKAYSD